MKLANIQHILAVARTGSLRAASRELGISQPTITRSIRDAENDVGTPLFTRQTHGVTLNESGKLFVRRAKIIESELRHIYEELEQAKGGYTGQVNIAMSAAASIALMPVVLNRFEKAYPHVLVNIVEGRLQPIETDILSGEIDFFVGPMYEQPASQSLLVEKLFDNRRSVVGRKGHAKSGAKSLAELTGARWVRPFFSNQTNKADFEALFERSGLPSPEVALHTRSIMITLLAVASSDLLAILPVQWLDISQEGQKVYPIDIAEDLGAAPICIVRRHDLPLTPLAERLCDMIRKAGINYGMTLNGDR